uniref:Uncharacterized protein n=1 Tax=viral metagenome TaxID=1070528 RepID=A0A6C0CUL7_9ZZZZ
MKKQTRVVLYIVAALALFYMFSSKLSGTPLKLTAGKAGGYMPDSHHTTCAKGSVPATNGLDCKIPTDRYGL